MEECIWEILALNNPFFIANGPEKRDTDFSWREFIERNNSELLGAYGNFINRTLAFIKKYYDGVLPSGIIDEEIETINNTIYLSVGQKIEADQFKDTLDTIFDFVRFENKYFDSKEPWNTRTSNSNDCGNTLYNCVQIIANLSVLLQPFLLFSSEKIFGWLDLNSAWRDQVVHCGYTLPEISILFERIDKSVIDDEVK